MQIIAACHNHLFMRRPSISWRVFTCAMEVLFPPSCHDAERDVSLQEWRGDRCTKETTQAPLASPDGSSLKALNYVSQRLTQSQDDLSALNISISCLRQTVTLLATREHWLAAKAYRCSTNANYNGIYGEVVSCLCHQLHACAFNKEIMHITVPEIKPPVLQFVCIWILFALQCCSTQASQQKMLQGKDEGAFHFNSQLWTFFV